MQTSEDKSQENQSPSTTKAGYDLNQISSSQPIGDRPDAVQMRNWQKMASYNPERASFRFVDNRPEAKQMKRLQESANNSPQNQQTAQLQEIANKHASRQGPAIQKKANPELFVPDTAIGSQRENNTGLPDNLKTGIENLSGYSMNDVKVHYNSEKPAQLQAHAYTQGTNIHVAPGQEKYLAHEAWHTVQQKQGRVSPTLQMKEGISINDDQALEKEADLMGEKALQTQPTERKLQTKPLNDQSNDDGIIQGVFFYSHKFKRIGGSFKTDYYYYNIGFIRIRSQDGYWIWADKRNAAEVRDLRVPDHVLLKFPPSADRDFEYDPLRPYEPAPPPPARVGMPQALPLHAPLPIIHIHNSCYLASILTLLAAVDNYKNVLFNPYVNVLTLPGQANSRGTILQYYVYPILHKISGVRLLPPHDIQGDDRALQEWQQYITGRQMDQLITLLHNYGILSGGKYEQQSAPEIMNGMLKLVRPISQQHQMDHFVHSHAEVTYDNAPVENHVPQPRVQSRGAEIQYMIQIPASRFNTLEEALVSEFPRQLRRDTFTMGTPVANPHNLRNSILNFPPVITFAVDHESNRDAIDMPSEFVIPRSCIDHYPVWAALPRYKLKGFIAHSNPSSELSARRMGHFIAYTQRNDQWFKSDDMGGGYSHVKDRSEPEVSVVLDIGKERHQGHKASTFALGSVYTYEKVHNYQQNRVALGEVEVDSEVSVHRGKLVEGFALFTLLLGDLVDETDKSEDNPLLSLYSLVDDQFSRKEIKPGLYKELLQLQVQIESLKSIPLATKDHRFNARVIAGLNVCKESLSILVYNGVDNTKFKPVTFNKTKGGGDLDSTWESSGLTWRDFVTIEKPDSEKSTDLPKKKVDVKQHPDILKEIKSKLLIIIQKQIGLQMKDLDEEVDKRAENLLGDLIEFHQLTASQQPLKTFVNEQLDQLLPVEMPDVHGKESSADFIKRIPNEADRAELTKAIQGPMAGMIQMLLHLDITNLLTNVGLDETSDQEQKDIRISTKYLTSRELKSVTSQEKDAVKEIVLKYNLLKNIASENFKAIIENFLGIKKIDKRPDDFIASQKEKEMLKKHLGKHVAKGIIKSVHTRARGLTGARGKVETVDRLEAKLESFAEGPPLTSHSLVLDTNAMRLFIFHHEGAELNYRDRGIFTHLLRIVKEREINEICLPNMAYIETANHYPGILSMNKIVVAGHALPIRGVPLESKRSETSYEKTYDALGDEKVGGGKENSSADISIVADSLFSQKEGSHIPVFSTNDKGIFNALWALARKKKRSDSIPKFKTIKQLRDDIESLVQPKKFYHPDYQYEPPQTGFDLTLHGHTIHVIPVGDSVSQYFEPVDTKEQRDELDKRKSNNPYAGHLFYQLPLGSNWLMGDLFRMIDENGGDARLTGGAIRDLQRYLNTSGTDIRALKKIAHDEPDKWAKIVKDDIHINDFDIVTTLTDTKLLELLRTHPLLKTVHMEHMPLRHMVVLAGGACEISCSKETEKGSKVIDMKKVALEQDFTMNSLFYKDEDDIDDPTGTGKDDLKSNTLKFSSYSIGGEKGLTRLLYQQPYLLGRLIKFVKRKNKADPGQVALMVKHFANAIESKKRSSTAKLTGEDIYAIKMILTKSGSEEASDLTQHMLDLGFSMSDVRLVLPGEVQDNQYTRWVTDEFKPPKVNTKWKSEPESEIRLNLDTGKLAGTRFYCRNRKPKGERLVIDQLFRTDLITHKQIPFYLIWRANNGKWSLDNTGLSKNGQPGIPTIENGIYKGPQLWKLEKKNRTMEDWADLFKQNKIKVKEYGEIVNLNGALMIHKDTLLSILNREDQETVRQFLLLVHNKKNPFHSFDISDEVLSKFTGKKENFRLRFRSMLKEVFEFASVVGIDLDIEPLKVLKEKDQAGLNARIRFYDLLHTKAAPWRLKIASDYAIGKKPSSVFEYVDFFEFALSQDVNSPEQFKLLDKQFESINVSDIVGQVIIDNFFAPQNSGRQGELIEANAAHLGFETKSSAKYHFSKHHEEFARKKKKEIDPKAYLAAAVSVIRAGQCESKELEQTGDYALIYFAKNIRTVIRVVRASGTNNGSAFIASSYKRY